MVQRQFPVVWITLAVLVTMLGGCTTPPAAGRNSDQADRPSVVDVKEEPQTTGAADQKESVPKPEEPKESEPQEPPLHLETPENVRGIYLTGWSAGIPERLADRIEYLKRNRLNTFVIDIKDDEGRLSFDLPGTRASAIGASAGKIDDPKQLLQRLHQQGIYVIGRLVTFADPYASQKYPEWSIRQNGQLWRDYRNISWLSPWSEEAWQYNIEIAVAAAKLGFDEIQFDYVRLPESRLPGYHDTTSEDRVKQITGFLSAAVEAIHGQAGVPVSADVFGISSVTWHDSYIGHSYPDIARVVDYISPMNYPSLYAKGELNIPDPYQRPFDIVWKTVLAAIQRTADLPLEVQRPWLQAYNYGPAGIEAQLEALASAGIRSFLLWNPQNVYPDGVNYNKIDQVSRKAPHEVWTPALYNLFPADLPIMLPATVAPLPEGNLYAIHSEAEDRRYSVELWASPQALPANDARILEGQPLLAVHGAVSEAEWPSLPREAEHPGTVPEESRLTLSSGLTASLTQVADGWSLSWRNGQAVYRVWMPDVDLLQEIAESMKLLQLSEGR